MKVGVRLRLLVGVVLCLSLGGALHAAGSAEDLFQQGLVKESGERNLDAAIELYKQAIAQAGTDRLVAFEARIRMGSCYERLGKTHDAEDVYEQVVQDSSSPQSEFAQEAQANLKRLQAQDRIVRVDSTTIKPETMVVATHEFKASRAAIAIGPAVLWSKGDSLEKLSLALRYRLSPLKKPSAIYFELGAITPIGDSHVMNEAKRVDAFSTDQGALNFHYQTSISVIGELPHGTQRTLIPEAGAGLSLTDAELSVGAASVSKKTISPYLTAGLHFYPDRPVSFLIQGAYTAVPFPETIQLTSHDQTFDVPNSLWTVTAKLQFKIGWPKIVVKRKK